MFKNSYGIDDPWPYFTNFRPFWLTLTTLNQNFKMSTHHDFHQSNLSNAKSAKNFVTLKLPQIALTYLNIDSKTSL